MDWERKRRINRLLIVLLLLTLCFIWGNSLLGPARSTGMSRAVLRSQRPLLSLFGLNIYDDTWLRKAAHFGEFGLLGAELMLLFALNAGRSLQSFCNGAGASLLVAVSDESLQILTGRYARVEDILLDFSGALAGLLLVLLALRLRKRRREKAGR